MPPANFRPLPFTPLANPFAPHAPSPLSPPRRPIMNLALTYDHRLIDGREAVTFLKRIKEIVEDPRRLLLDV